jgi:putative membrane protein
MRKEILLSGATGFLALAMIGCSGTATNTTNTAVIPANNGNVAVVTNTNTTAVGTTAGNVSNDDREFFTEAAQGGIFEVKMAQLVVGKTQNPEIKAFAQRMIADHTKANDELKALAAKKGVNLPTDFSDDHRKHYDDLAKLNGGDFDKEYVSMMVDDHDDDVEEFGEQANEADDADLKAFAAKTLPVLQSHQAQIKAIESKMK